MHDPTASETAELSYPSRKPAPEQIRGIAIPAAVTSAAFLLYWFTAARHPGWVDATLILNLVRNLELGVWANIHNLFNVMGYAWLRLFHSADPHFALTLLCSLLGSLTVLFMYEAGVELTGNSTASVLACAALTLSLSLWWHSTTIEVYTLNTTLIAAFLYLIFRAYRGSSPKPLYLAFFLGGLGISNHVLMGLYVAAFVAVLLPFAARRFRLKAPAILGLVLCYLAGTSLFSVLFLLHWAWVYRTMASSWDGGAPGLAFASLGATLRYATGGHFLKSMFTSGLSTQEKLFWRGNYLFLILLNYPSAAVAFIAAGFPRLWRYGWNRDRGPAWRGPVLFFLVGIAAQIVWSANYFIWDMYAFSLPVYVMLFVPLVLGIDGFLKGHAVPNWRWLIFLTFLIPLFLYPSFSRWPNRENTVDRYISLYPEAERTGGLWDPAEYIFNPIKRNYDAVAEFNEGILDTLPDGAVFWDDESKAAYPLEYYYQEVLGRRPDIKLNSVFGLVMEESKARSHARRMLGQLRRGERVFVSALVEPQREILNQLYGLLEPAAEIEQIRRFTLEEFRSSFPQFRIVTVPVGEEGSFQIYELRPRGGNP